VRQDPHPVPELAISLDGFGTLISGLAHHLRNLLNGMTMRLELLRHEIGDVGERHLDKLREDITRLNEAIEVLVKYVLPGELKFTSLDMNDLLKEIGGRVASDRIIVEYKLDSELPLVRADRGMVYDALTNVVTNAEQAMPEGGRLMLTTASLSPVVEVKIADEGSGIAMEELPRVFELYYTTKAAARGLGLFLARRAIELNGGCIAVDSQVDQGTICIVRLPISHNTPG
jgi:two-component system, NtrC family, sensor histidine kinase HydH